jgi:hypothetical protein
VYYRHEYAQAFPFGCSSFSLGTDGRSLIDSLPSGNSSPLALPTGWNAHRGVTARGLSYVRTFPGPGALQSKPANRPSKRAPQARIT